jgi:hypothetical protein
MPTARVRQALSLAARAYEAIGVSLRWVDGHDEMPVAAGVLRVDVTLLSRRGMEKFLRGQNVPRAVLGAALTPTNRVYIFTPRIAVLAIGSRQPLEMLLGRVLAHEIGHLLLPGQGHSESGIMRAQSRWDPGGFPSSS